MGKIRATVELKDTYEILKHFHITPGDSITINNIESGIEVKMNNYFTPTDGKGGIGYISKLYLSSLVYIEEDFILNFGTDDGRKTYLRGDIIFTTDLSEQEVVNIAAAWQLVILNISKIG